LLIQYFIQFGAAASRRRFPWTPDQHRVGFSYSLGGSRWFPVFPPPCGSLLLLPLQPALAGLEGPLGGRLSRFLAKLHGNGRCQPTPVCLLSTRRLKRHCDSNANRPSPVSGRWSSRACFKRVVLGMSIQMSVVLPLFLAQCVFLRGADLGLETGGLSSAA
jgi:hypothetical protein